jgi:hypothetical protein
VTTGGELEAIESWVESALGPAPSFKGARYLREYRRLLGDEAASTRSVVELGIAEGASLLAWSRLFPNAKIIGVDRRWPQSLPGALARLGLEERVKLVEGDHAEPASFAPQIPDGVDLVVDDGSHLLEPTRRCFAALFPKLRPGGWYTIEDWGAGYWESFGGPEGGVHRLIYQLVDELAIKDRMKPEAGTFRVPAREPMPIEEVRIKGVEPIVFIRRKAR